MVLVANACVESDDDAVVSMLRAAQQTVLELARRYRTRWRYDGRQKIFTPFTNRRF